jgi:hypothetical protein
MRAVLIILSLAAGLALAACQPAAIVHDKTYFAGHAAERAQTLAACRNDPGQLGGTPNCVNAIQADADAEHERVFHSARPAAPGVNNASHL